MLVCDNCGEQNFGRARFCHACGHALATEAAPRETRKAVTVVFCDVTGSTALGEQLDPESQRAVMGRYFDEMRIVLERHGGTVEKFIGDAVMAVFGVPQLHEDDALRAVRAAAEMRERLAELNVELERDHGVRIAMRVGVNTGEVVAGDPGDRQRFVTGDPVVVAKRLESAAGAGEILLGLETARLVHEATVLEELDPLPLKGKARPVEAWRLLEVSADAFELGRRLDAPLVGRQAELTRLLAEVDAIELERTAKLITVVGEAGLGKSRLARELGERLGDRACFLTGRCLPYGDGITFWPLREIVAQAGGPDALAHRLGHAEEAAVVLERVRGAIGAGDVEGGGEETFWAVRKLVEALARDEPLVLCLEDVHWAEPTFLELVEYLAGWIRDSPVLLLCLARPELAEEHPAWAGARADAVLALPPLTNSESAELVGALGELDEDTSARIAAAAEGNPLFAEQLAAFVAEEPAAGAAIPPTIQALLAARLDRLEPRERAVLERAAVMGREFWRRAVVDLTPERERAQAGSHLHALVRRNLIRPDPGPRSEDGFRFSHVLVRDAAYAAVPKETRADLHERFAAWIEANAGRWAAEVEEIVGYHLEQAYRYREQLGPVDERARAVASRAADLLGGAGRRAFARDDMPAAVSLLDRAVALATAQEPATLELRHDLSGALWSIGEAARAEVLLDGIVTAAAAAGERRIEWYAVLERAGRRWLTARTEVRPDELLTIARGAVDVFEELGDDLGLARAWQQMARAQRGAGRYGESQAAGERALEHARRAGSHQTQARVVDTLCISLLYGPAPVSEALSRCRELLALAGASRLLEANVVSALAGLDALRGSFDSARVHVANARAIYDEVGVRLAVAGLTQIAGPLEVLAGDLPAAEDALREGYEILVPLGAAGYQAALLAEVVALQGRLDEARGLATIARKNAGGDLTSEVMWRCAAARLDPTDGAGLAREAVRIAAGTDILTLHGDACATLADVLLGAGAAEEAGVAAREALNLYERKGNVAAARRIEALAAGVNVIGRR